MKKVYMIENVTLGYACEVCSNRAIALRGLDYYNDVIGRGYEYRIRVFNLIDKSLQSQFNYRSRR